MSDPLFDQFPFELDIVTMACYEAAGKPIILKNGAKAYPQGWLRFLKLKASDILNEN